MKDNTNNSSSDYRNIKNEAKFYKVLDQKSEEAQIIRLFGLKHKMRHLYRENPQYFEKNPIARKILETPVGVLANELGILKKYKITEFL